MREIKFRAWLKYEKKMVDLEMISFNNNGVIIVGKGTIKSRVFLFDQIELMQYTGLKDKNGVEIYEGDIVDDFGTRCSVIWEQFDCSFQLSYSRYQCSLGEYDTNTIEVIGNIYENPELLEK